VSKRGSKGTKRPTVHRPHAERRTKATAEQAQPAVTAERLPAAEPGDPAQWPKTRRGAAAGRGFQYQEAVAALYAARLLESDAHTLVVPEGSHEDIHCQGSSAVAVQAKSRQDRTDRRQFVPVAVPLSARLTVSRVVDAYGKAERPLRSAALGTAVLLVRCGLAERRFDPG
jgi:hypothetical protein